MQKIKLFCFPHSGGSSATFIPWKDYIDNGNIEIYGMDLPGRGKRFSERLLHSMQEAVDDAYDKIKHQLDRSPYAFFGHSLGCLLACELAYKIVSAGNEDPVHIFFSGHTPNDVEEKACFSEKALNKFVMDFGIEKDILLRDVGHTIMDNKRCFAKNDIENIMRSHPDIYRALSIKMALPPDLPEDEFIREAIDMRSENREIFDNQELKELLLPILRSDVDICHSYKWTPKPYRLKSDITVPYGIDEECITTKDIERWKEHTEKDCRILPFRGGHFYFENNLKELTAIINHTLLSYIQNG